MNPTGLAHHPAGTLPSRINPDGVAAVAAGKPSVPGRPMRKQSVARPIGDASVAVLARLPQLVPPPRRSSRFPATPRTFWISARSLAHSGLLPTNVFSASTLGCIRPHHTTTGAGKGKTKSRVGKQSRAWVVSTPSPSPTSTVAQGRRGARAGRRHHDIAFFPFRCPSL